MPLRAILDGSRHVLSFALPPDQPWDAIRAASQARRLTLPCCGAHAVAKQWGSTGTRAFAHWPGTAECRAWRPESELHLRLKTAAAEAALARGASVETEIEGPGWRADVLCTHDGVRRAVEIQLSPQTYRVTLERTEAYRANGVDVLWVFRSLPAGLEIDSEFPVIALPEDPAGMEPLVREVAGAYAVGRLEYHDGHGLQKLTLVGYDAPYPSARRTPNPHREPPRRRPASPSTALPPMISSPAASAGPSAASLPPSRVAPGPIPSSWRPSWRAACPSRGRARAIHRLLPPWRTRSTPAASGPGTTTARPSARRLTPRTTPP